MASYMDAKSNYFVLSYKQGRLEPVQAYLKNNKRGLGADKVKKTAKKPHDTAASNDKNDQVSCFIWII